MHDAILGFDAWIGSVLDFAYRRLLEDLCAILFRSPRLTDAKIKWMQVSIAAINQAADVDIRSDHRMHVLLAGNAYLGKADPLQ